MSSRDAEGTRKDRLAYEVRSKPRLVIVQKRYQYNVYSIVAKIEEKCWSWEVTGSKLRAFPKAPLKYVYLSLSVHLLLDRFQRTSMAMQKQNEGHLKYTFGVSSRFEPREFT